MERIEAIEIISRELDGTELVVCANGMICRERFVTDDKPQNFYMLGSMGLASCIGLGVACVDPGRKVVVLDGDGNLLMNLGAVGMVGDAAPENYYHILLDNAAYGSTGGQRTVSPVMDFTGIARSSGYRTVSKADSPDDLAAMLKELLASAGPSFLWVPVQGGNIKGIPRVDKSPQEIRDRVCSFLAHE